MPKYHINNNGELAICLAIFKSCPYKQHFNSKEEGQKYINEWDSNRIKYSKLSNESILEPNKNKIDLINNFKNKEYFDGLYISEDSFAVILDESSNQKIQQYINNLILSGKMSINHIGNATIKSANKGFAVNLDWYTGKVGNASKEQKESYLKDLTRMTEEFSKEAGVNYAAQCYGYKISDIMIDKNTKLRAFTREPEIEYKFEEELYNV